jgi:hypothetical protein
LVRLCGRPAGRPRRWVCVRGVGCLRLPLWAPGKASRRLALRLIIRASGM